MTKNKVKKGPETLKKRMDRINVQLTGISKQIRDVTDFLRLGAFTAVEIGGLRWDPESAEIYLIKSDGNSRPLLQQTIMDRLKYRGDLQKLADAAIDAAEKALAESGDQE